MGWEIVYPEDNEIPDAILVVGGTKKILWLRKMKKLGVPIIYRLDGMNWLHNKVFQGINQWIVNELRNFLMKIIHSHFASSVVYQSRFVEQWWQTKGWKSSASKQIIYNGVSLDLFTKADTNIENQEISILSVEGTIDYSPYSVELLNQIQEGLIEKSSYKSLIVYGKFKNKENEKKLSEKIVYRGFIDRKDLPKIYQKAVYLSLDVNPACPNTVIEALASGIPVIGFDTGSLRELVPSHVGKVVDYGGNPWTLDYPDVEALIQGAKNILSNWEFYSINARKLAEEKYDLNTIVENYIKVIKPDLLNNNY